MGGADGAPPILGAGPGQPRSIRWTLRPLHRVDESILQRWKFSREAPEKSGRTLARLAAAEGSCWGAVVPSSAPVAVPRGTVAHYLPGEVGTRSRSFLASPPHVTDVPLLRSYNKTSDHGFLDLCFSFETSTQPRTKDASLACSVSVEQLRGALQPELPRHKCYALGLHCFAVRGVSPFLPLCVFPLSDGSDRSQTFSRWLSTKAPVGNPATVRNSGPGATGLCRK